MQAKYIWYDNSGVGRNLYACFRKTFVLSDDVKEAQINIFADTEYQLFINGVFVEFGPVRFDPRYPLYDNHNIAKFLHKDKNAIAIQVNFIGHKTFKNIPIRGGMIAWGNIVEKNGNITCLNTDNKSWKCIENKAYMPSPKLSFALNAADIYNQNYEQEAWKCSDFDDSSWPYAVELDKQDSWGNLEKRYIPYMSGKNIKIDNIKKVLRLEKKEDIYSFSIPTYFVEEEHNDKYSNFIACSTWIYSPEDTYIPVGTFYGDTWINGKKIEDGIESANKSLRINQIWHLNAGWNYYFCVLKAYQGVTSHYIGLPSGKGFIVAADKDLNAKYIFRHTNIITKAEYESYILNKSLPFDIEDRLDEIGGWVYTTEKDRAEYPCIEYSWSDFGECIEKVKTDDLNGHIFKKEYYPHGFMLLIDLGQMNLVIPSLVVEGVKGARIDIIYSEHINPDNEHLRILSWVPLGDRVICSKNTLDWMPSHPRGFRYLGLIIRDADNDVTIKSLTFRSANYPTKQVGSFKCSDACLTEIWNMGMRTERVNMEDAYVDCSGRERGMYIRDTIIQYHVNLATFGDNILFRRCVELFSQSPDSTGKFRAVYPNTGTYTISDFALNMLEGYVALYENTGDLSIVKRYWNGIMTNLKWFNDLSDEREDGLLDAEWDIHRGIKADYGGFHGDLNIAKGYMSTKGIHCAFSIIYLDALKCAYKLALLIGKSNDAEALKSRIDKLTKNIVNKFWDKNKKCFADNLDMETHSVQANLLAVRSGLVDDEKLYYIKEHISNLLKSIFVNGYDPKDGVLMSPSFAFYLFDGLYKAGLYNIAENIMKQGWGWALSQGLKTCPEYFELFDSLCHAWSASPTYYLSKNVLGVNFPNAPDLNYVEIIVKTNCVTWAEGSYPHPKGTIEIKWHMENNKRIFDYIKAPQGVTVIIKE